MPKKYQVFDLYECYGSVGEFDTYGEACMAAAFWRKETDGECDLVILKWNDTYQAYTSIEQKVVSVCR